MYFIGKNLVVLQQRRQEILSQLEKVVGKNAVSAISNRGGGNNGNGGNPNDDFSIWSNSLGPTFVRSDSILMDDDYVPFEAPVNVSKYGPISRMNSKQTNVQSPFGDTTISTSMLRTRPVSATTASPPSWYLNQNAITNQDGSNGSGYVITTHHHHHGVGGGIMDHPPQQLYIQCQSKEIKQQIRSLERKINDLKLVTRAQHVGGLNESERLAQELQLIEQGIIVEKEKEARLVS